MTGSSLLTLFLQKLPCASCRNTSLQNNRITQNFIMPFPNKVWRFFHFLSFFLRLLACSPKPTFDPCLTEVKSWVEKIESDDSWWPTLIDSNHSFNPHHCVSLKMNQWGLRKSAKPSTPLREILSFIHTSAHFGFGSVSTVTIYNAAGGTPGRSIVLDNILIIEDCWNDPETAKPKL